MGDARYILWDDPFSSVDVILEKNIMEELKQMGALERRTLILTSHRISTIRYCSSVNIVEKDVYSWNIIWR